MTMYAMLIVYGSRIIRYNIGYARLAVNYVTIPGWTSCYVMPTFDYYRVYQ